MPNAPPQTQLICSLTGGAAFLVHAIRVLAAIAFLLGVLIYPGAARADYATPHAEVVCQKGRNAALIRFTMTPNEDPIIYRRLPARIDDGLSATRTLGRSNCHMANGWTIRIRHGERQAFAYGMGGASPPAFFSLWIAQRKILSRKEWMPGYGHDYLDHGSRWLIGLVIRPDRLTYCYDVGGSDAPEKGAISCQDEAFRLERYKVDHIEYARPGSHPAVGTILLARGSVAPRICRKFLRLGGGSFSSDVSAVHTDTANVFEPPSPGRDPALSIDVARVEIAPGVHRKLIRWSGMSGYFDGDIMLLAPPASDPWTILKPDMLDDDADKFPSNKLPARWNVIAGGLPDLYPTVPWRYIHFDTQWIDKQLYLLAQPSNVENRPAAILIQPLAQGFRRVCVFQRVKPHF